MVFIFFFFFFLFCFCFCFCLFVVFFLLQGTFSLEKWKSKWPTVRNMCLQKLWKMQLYLTKHAKWCSIGNRNHCGITSVILNIFREQKYWWQVWLLRGRLGQCSVMYLWTVRANVRSQVLLDLGIESGTTWSTQWLIFQSFIFKRTHHRNRGK